MIRPVIALVGRPNVGKSTLFNRLVGRRRSIVHDVPGVTRDRLYGTATFERWQATIVDTGGFDPSTESNLIAAVRDQVMTAIEDSWASLDHDLGVLHQLGELDRRAHV